MLRNTYTLRVNGNDIDLHLTTVRKHEVVPGLLGFAAQLSFIHASPVRLYENGMLFREVCVRTIV